MALPTATFDPTKMIVGRQSILVVTIATVATNLLVDLVDFAGSLDIARIQAPGATNGPAYTAKIWDKSRSEMLKVKCKEIKKVITLLGSLTGLKHGTCTAYIRDPEDAANVVALKSDDFAMTIYRDPADINFSDAAPAEVTLIIESRKDGAIAWDDDASTA